jgi:N-terminal half of MaoC dehydratase
MGDGAVVQRVRAQIGWRTPARRSVVEAGHVRRFCEAIGDDDPRWLEEVPPTFVVALATETPPIPGALEYGRGWLNGGDRFEYLEPVRPGDEIEASTVLVDAYEKRGSSGDLLFLILETEFRNQHGRTAVRVRGTRIRR